MEGGGFAPSFRAAGTGYLFFCNPKTLLLHFARFHGSNRVFRAEKRAQVFSPFPVEIQESFSFPIFVFVISP